MNEVTGYLQGNELVIALSGRIDSNNAMSEYYEKLELLCAGAFYL